MNRKLHAQRREILTEIEEEFIGELIPAKLVTDEELQIDTLTVLLEEFVMEGLESAGKFFFIPTGKEDDIQIFSNVITIMEELSDENLPELMSALAMVNGYTPVGCFTLDAVDRTLVYRHNYELPLELDNDTLKSFVDLSMSAALRTVEKMGYLLVQVNEGERKAMDVLDVLLA